MAAAGLLALSGCAFHPLGSHAPRFSAELSGADERVPNRSLGGGALEATLNRDTHLLRWHLSYSKLSGPVTGGHFQGPAAGDGPGVTIPFISALESPIEGQATLTPEQMLDLMAGKWSVNLQTRAYPQGEIRGRLTLRR